MRYEQLTLMLQQAVNQGGVDRDLHRSLATYFYEGGALIADPNPAAELLDLIAKELRIDRLLEWISKR